jgi:hypothetical protein
MSHVRLRAVWREMLRRCEDLHDRRYPSYGGRGVRVCAEWHKWETFHAWAVEAGYRQGLSIERIDNEGAYEPANCMWATASQQGRNKRTNRLVTAFGETKCVTEWAEDSRCAVSANTLWQRIAGRWIPERALTTPSDTGRRFKHERAPLRSSLRTPPDAVHFGPVPK